MAPECFKQNKKYSYKSDIWSLGCCIYEMCNLKHAFEGQFFPAVSIKISEGKRLPVNKIYSKELRNVIDSMLDLNPRNRPTIASLIEKTFLKKFVGEYINDFISNYRRYDGNEEQINILKEQAEKFQVFDVKLNLDNFNGCYNINNNVINNINNNDINDKNYFSIININKEYKKAKKSFDFSPEQKNKKDEINNFINTNKILPKQQSTINYYNDSIENHYYINNNNMKNKAKIKKVTKNYELGGINEKNKSHNFYSFNEINKINKHIETESNAKNEKELIINKRIKYFKERSIKALGNNFYNKAYNYLKKMKNNNSINNETKREYLSDTFGKNNIGYWQLIDQILILENILETS